MVFNLTKVSDYETKECRRPSLLILFIYLLLTVHSSKVFPGKTEGVPSPEKPRTLIEAFDLAKDYNIQEVYDYYHIHHTGTRKEQSLATASDSEHDSLQATSLLLPHETTTKKELEYFLMFLFMGHLFITTENNDIKKPEITNQLYLFIQALEVHINQGHGSDTIKRWFPMGIDITDTSIRTYISGLYSIPLKINSYIKSCSQVFPGSTGIGYLKDSKISWTCSFQTLFFIALCLDIITTSGAASITDIAARKGVTYALDIIRKYNPGINATGGHLVTVFDAADAIKKAEETLGKCPIWTYVIPPLCGIGCGLLVNVLNQCICNRYISNVKTRIEAINLLSTQDSMEDRETTESEQIYVAPSQPANSCYQRFMSCLSRSQCCKSNQKEALKNASMPEQRWFEPYFWYAGRLKKHENYLLELKKQKDAQKLTTRIRKRMPGRSQPKEEEKEKATKAKGWWP